MSKNQKLFMAIRYVLRPIKRNLKRLVHVPGDIKRNKKIHRRIVLKNNNSESINVLFLLQYPEMWNSYKSIYDAFVKDRRFKISIITIPKQVGVNSSDGEFDDINEAAEFCKKSQLDYIDARQKGEWVNIDLLSPDLIFIQRPYDECMPLHLTLKKLAQKALLCYVPYGYEFVNNVHLDIEYNDNFINSVFFCFAENEDTIKYIKNRSRIDTLFGLRKVFDLGYPRFDLITKVDMNSNCRKCVLWTPRWSVSDINDRSYFFDYIEPLKTYFAENKDAKLIIRPHPLMFKNFIEKGILTKEDIDNLKDEISSFDNIEWDNNQNYLDTFEKSEILISDFSSLIIEFFATNKPVVYCGSHEGFNTIGMEMAKGLYHVTNKEELISTLNYLRNNYDKYFELNQLTINNYIKKTENIGVSIKDEIVKSFF